MKILFTCVGRRVELVQAFRRAAEALGMELTIFGADMDGTAPALQFCDKDVRVPKIRSGEYLPFLLDYCEKEHIDAVIPTIDTDLPVLAENKRAFEDRQTRVVISTPEKIALCGDKALTARYFVSLGLCTPATVETADQYNGGYPAFIKPRKGSSSVDAYKVGSRKELRAVSAMVPDPIIQPFVSGMEYTVDVLCDLEGSPVYITPRQRLAVRAGEVLKTRICHEESIIRDVEKLVEEFRPCGPITVQLIKEETSGVNRFLEINPRFGGGAPLSMGAGADSASALLRVLRGETVGYLPRAAEDGAVFSRFDQSVRIL